MLRVTPVLIALILIAPLALAAKPKLVREVVLKGKFIVPEEGGELVFKAGGKKFTIDLKTTHLQKHRVEKLKDIPAGTQMNVFAKYTEWADGDEFERMACLVAGQHFAPRHRPASRNMATWHQGRLHFVENKSIAFVDGASLPTGVDRPTCVIDNAELKDFFETKKSGKKKAKPAYIRGKYMAIQIRGKKQSVFVPLLITLPTRGIPSKEYKYILDPSKMYEDLGG